MERRKFIISLGKVAALLSDSGLWLSCKNSGEENFEMQLRDISIHAFKRYEKVWNFNDFWKRGNTFDACLNFMMAIQEKWHDDLEIPRSRAVCCEKRLLFS